MTDSGYARRRTAASIIGLVVTAATGSAAIAWAATTTPATTTATATAPVPATASTTAVDQQQRIRELRHRLAVIRHDLPGLLRDMGTLPRGEDAPPVKLPTATYVPPAPTHVTAPVAPAAAPPAAAPPVSHTTTGASGAVR